MLIYAQPCVEYIRSYEQEKIDGWIRKFVIMLSVKFLVLSIVVLSYTEEQSIQQENTKGQEKICPILLTHYHSVQLTQYQHFNVPIQY